MSNTTDLLPAQKAMQSGDFAGGLAIAQAALASDPGNGEALYMAAVAQRYLGRLEQADATLARLHDAIPEYGRAWQEAGHLARARGDTGAAIAAYQRATRFNPALESSWRMLAEMLTAEKRSAEAAQAHAQFERLAGMPRELVAVSNHLHEGRILHAEQICRAYLRTHPRDVEGMRLLAEIGKQLGVLDDAEFLLESAREFDPDNVQVRLDYVNILRRRQKFQRAMEEAEALHAQDPTNVVFMSHLAVERMQTGDYDGAFALFDDILAVIPDDPATLTNKGHALKTTGRQEEAVAAYRAAIAARPDYGDAHYALANLKTYTFSDAEIATMEAQAERSDLGFMDRVHLAFALGKAQADRRDYAASFAQYEKGNSLKRAQTRYNADAITREFERMKVACTPELFAQHEGHGYQAPDPIFIVGLPRAGSTLLEQVLASHSQIDGTLELPNILALVHRLRGRTAGQSLYPEILADLSKDQLEEFGRQFIEDTRIHRQNAPFFIDKMPNNFRHIGLIHLMLPNATIIDARRDPMDCCFSGFRQLFAEGQEFTYGLEEVGRYYADYVDLMDHWDEVLPGKVLRVQHEDVLDDLEGQTRRMLDHIGIEFEEECLQFYKTDRAVRTASSEQVRRPINRAGQNAWKPFEPWLDQLKAALGDKL